MYPVGELRGLVPIPYVALQDTRHGHPGGKPFIAEGDHQVAVSGATIRRCPPAASGGAEPGRPKFHVMDLHP